MRRANSEHSWPGLSNSEPSLQRLSNSERPYPGLSTELASLLDGPEPPQRRLASGTVRRRRLMIVEPDAVYRIGLEEPLEAMLWSSIGWADAGEAVAWLAGNPEALVDALWCEHELRNGSATALVERVRALRPGLPALVVSTRAPDAAAQTYPEGVQFFGKKQTAEAVRVLAGIADAPREQLQELVRREA